MESERAELQATIASQQSDHEREVATLKEEIRQLTGQCEDLQERVKQLESDVEEKSQEVRVTERKSAGLVSTCI